MAATVDDPGPGRPLGFDPDAALDDVLGEFWRRGFERTSVADLERATSLSRPSLYNTFGSKDEMYRIALDRYLDRLDESLAEAFVGGPDGLGEIASWLRGIADGNGEAVDRTGCAMINASVAFGDADPIVGAATERYAAFLRRHVERAADGAVGSGSVDPVDRDDVVDVAICSIYGLSALARAAPTRRRLDASCSAAIAALEHFRR